MSNNSSQKGTIAVLASTNRKRRSSDKAAVWATELGRAHEAVDIIHVNLKDLIFQTMEKTQNQMSRALKTARGSHEE